MKTFAACLTLTLFVCRVAVASDGCPPGSFSITNTPDGHAASVLFDAFTTTAGAGNTASSSLCELAIPVTVPKGIIALYKSDYRGFVLLAPAQSATLVVTQAQGHAVYAFSGPFEDALDTSLTSASNAAGHVELRVALDVRSAADLPQASATLDSIDLAETNFTSFDSVARSVRHLARARTLVVVQASAVAHMLLGFNEPIDAPSSARATISTGPDVFGADARWRNDSTVTLLGGVALLTQSTQRANIRGAAVGAIGARYLTDGVATVRPFFEGGFWGSPDLDMRVERNYLNGSSMTRSNGWLVGGYARAGGVLTPTPDIEAALWVALARSWLHVDHYAEGARATNAFAADVPSKTTSPYVTSLGASWTQRLVPAVDVTLSLVFRS